MSDLLIGSMAEGEAGGKEGGVEKGLPQCVRQNLFVKSSPNPEEFTTKVEGYQFTKPGQAGSAVDYHALLQSFRTSGFQATNVALAIDQINLMVSVTGGVWVGLILNGNQLISRACYPI